MFKKALTSLWLLVLLWLIVSPTAAVVSAFVLGPPSSNHKIRPPATGTVLHMSSSSSSVQQEIEVIAEPDPAFLEQKGVFGWGTWGCGVSKFPWTYGEAESCYLLKGKVVVTPDGGSGEPVTIQAGNFVTFPAGMSCTWDVLEAVEKHFMFF